LLEKKSEHIRHICLPAELSDNVFPPEVRECYVGGLLDPVRLNRAVIEEAKIDLGSRGYAGQYGQSPTADGGNIVKKSWFQFTNRESFNRMRTTEPIVFFLDTAFTDTTENDPTGIIATCKIGNDLFISHAQKAYKEFPELIKFIPIYTQNRGYNSQSTIRIEPKANGKSIVQQLKNMTKLNVTETPTPTDSKETRLTAASPKIECGRVILVADIWNEEFIDEICGFPGKVHDEYVDLICYAINYHLKDTVSNAKQLTSLFH